MTTALDLLIGLTFVFLLFSLVVTASSELILAKLDKRAKFLQEGLHELLQSKELVAKLCSHGLVNALARDGSSRPSYIDASTFSAALLDVIQPASLTGGRDKAALVEGIRSLFIAGLTGFDLDGKFHGKDDPAAQADQAMKNLKILVEEEIGRASCRERVYGLV